MCMVNSMVLMIHGFSNYRSVTDIGAKKMSKGSESGADTIQVYCRIRPVDESFANYSIEQSFEKSNLLFKKPKSAEAGVINNSLENFNFTFNGIFDHQVDQEEVFERCAKKCVLSAMEGYNSTIFAYGQSGSGKWLFRIVI